MKLKAYVVLLATLGTTLGSHVARSEPLKSKECYQAYLSFVDENLPKSETAEYWREFKKFGNKSFGAGYVFLPLAVLFTPYYLAKDVVFAPVNAYKGSAYLVRKYKYSETINLLGLLDGKANYDAWGSNSGVSIENVNLELGKLTQKISSKLSKPVSTKVLFSYLGYEYTNGTLFCGTDEQAAFLTLDEIAHSIDQNIRAMQH